MKFSLGDSVRIKGSGLKGTIQQCEKREVLDHSGFYEIERYFVKTDVASFPEWYHASQLEHWGIDKETEQTIDKMLIDVHLKYRQFDVVKGIVNDKENNK